MGPQTWVQRGTSEGCLELAGRRPGQRSGCPVTLASQRIRKLAWRTLSCALARHAVRLFHPRAWEAGLPNDSRYCSFQFFDAGRYSSDGTSGNITLDLGGWPPLTWEASYCSSVHPAEPRLSAPILSTWGHLTLTWLQVPHAGLLRGPVRTSLEQGPIEHLLCA